MGNNEDAKDVGGNPTNPDIQVDYICLGNVMHTNLRKLCDDKVTSLAYNLIILCDEAWIDYLESAWDKLQGVDESKMPFALKAAVVALDYGGSAERNALRLVLGMFDEDMFRTMGSGIFKEKRTGHTA